MLNGIIFADDMVIKSMLEFSENATLETYVKVVANMRKDLWGNKTKINEKTLLKIFNKANYLLDNNKI